MEQPLLSWGNYQQQEKWFQVEKEYLAIVLVWEKFNYYDKGWGKDLVEIDHDLRAFLKSHCKQSSKAFIEYNWNYIGIA